MSDLLGKSTVKRRKEAIQIQKKLFGGDKICKELYLALKIEEGTKNWLTKVEIIRAIGMLTCSDIANYVYETYIKTSEEHSLIAQVASTAYIRLKRNNNNDASIVLELLNIDKYSVTEGALEALGYDKMCPALYIQDKIIEKCFSFGNNREQGYTDPRYGLAAACAGWESEKVIPFLEECLKANDTPLRYVAEKSLKKKYVKLR